MPLYGQLLPTIIQHPLAATNPQLMPPPRPPDPIHPPGPLLQEAAGPLAAVGWVEEEESGLAGDAGVG